MSDLLLWSLVAGTTLALLLEMALPATMPGRARALIFIVGSLLLGLLVVWITESPISPRGVAGSSLAVLVSALATGHGLWPSLLTRRTTG